MNFIEQLERFQKIDQLLKCNATGTPDDFSRKIGVSRSHLYQLLNFLKDYGAPIKYSRKQESFYYSEPYILEVSLFKKKNGS